MKRIFSVLVVLFATLFITQFAYADYLKPTGYVNDYANVLSPSFKTSEEKKLSAYTKQTSNEIAVVTVATTGDMIIDDYAQGLFDQWKPGVSGKDNGIIILFAMQDHKDRIQTGCGLEGALSDAQEQDILNTQTQPLMRAGKYDQAIDITVNAVQNQIKGKTLSPCTIGSQKAIDQARANTATTAKNRSSGIGLWLLILICIIVVVLIITIASESDGEDGGFGLGTLVGGIGGALLNGGGDDDSGGGGFGGFSGGSSSGGGATGGW